MADIAVDEIPLTDQLSRFIDSPHKYSEREQELLAENVFMFNEEKDGRRRESLVWRRHKPHIGDVHILGCQIQENKKANKPDYRYKGAITADVQRISLIRSTLMNGFSVKHDPEEGVWHVEISYAQHAGPITRNERTELRAKLREVFGAIEPHSCG